MKTSSKKAADIVLGDRMPAHVKKKMARDAAAAAVVLDKTMRVSVWDVNDNITCIEARIDMYAGHGDDADFTFVRQYVDNSARERVIDDKMTRVASQAHHIINGLYRCRGMHESHSVRLMIINCMSPRAIANMTFGPDSAMTREVLRLVAVSLNASDGDRLVSEYVKKRI